MARKQQPRVARQMTRQLDDAMTDKITDQPEGATPLDDISGLHRDTINAAIASILPACNLFLPTGY